MAINIKISLKNEPIKLPNSHHNLIVGEKFLFFIGTKNIKYINIANNRKKQINEFIIELLLLWPLNVFPYPNSYIWVSMFTFCEVGCKLFTTICRKTAEKVVRAKGMWRQKK